MHWIRPALLRLWSTSLTRAITFFSAEALFHLDCPCRTKNSHLKRGGEAEARTNRVSGGFSFESLWRGVSSEAGLMRKATSESCFRSEHGTLPCPISCPLAVVNSTQRIAGARLLSSAFAGGRDRRSVLVVFQMGLATPRRGGRVALSPRTALPCAFAWGPSWVCDGGAC